MKTIYARLGDLSMGETLEDGTSLGNLSGTLEQIGVQVLDNAGSMREMGDILEDLMDKWNTFDMGQKQALAVKLAGKYQYNRLMALMENSEMYNQMMEESASSEGFLQRTQDIYMESLEAKSQSLQAAFEGLTSELFDPESLKPFLDVLTNIVSALGDFVNIIGGGGTVTAALGGLATSFFSKNIASGITNVMSNMELKRLQGSNVENTNRLMREHGIMDVNSERTQGFRTYIDRMTAAQGYMSEQDRVRFNENVDAMASALNELEIAQEKVEQSVIATSAAYKTLGVDIGVVVDKEGKISNLSEFLSLLNDDSFALTKKQVASMDLTKMSKGATAASSLISKMLDDKQTIDTKNLDSLAKNIKKIDAASGESSKRIGGLLQLIEAIDNKTIQGAENINLALQTVQNEINDFVRSSQDMKNAVSSGEELLKRQIEYEQAEARKQGLDALAKSDIDEMAFKTAVADIASLVGAMGMFHSAMLSINNVMQVWTSDATIGEKVSSTLENILFTAPMLVSSFIEMNDAVKNLEKTNGLASIAAKLNTSATVINTSSIEKNTIAKSKNSVAGNISDFFRSISNGIKGAAGKALTGILSLLSKTAIPLMIVDAVGQIITGIISGIEAQAKEERQNRLQEYSSKKEEFSSNQDQFNQLTNLYTQYKETGKATDDFINILDSLADSFGINNKTVLLATKQYDQLTAAIKSAMKQEYDRQIQLSKQAKRDLVEERKDEIKSANAEFKQLYGSGKNILMDNMSEINSAYREVYDESAKQTEEEINAHAQAIIDGILTIDAENLDLEGSVLYQVADTLGIDAKDLALYVDKNKITITPTGEIYLENGEIISKDVLVAAYQSSVVLETDKGEPVPIDLLTLVGCQSQKEFDTLLDGVVSVTVTNENGEPFTIEADKLISPQQLATALAQAGVNYDQAEFSTLYTSILTGALGKVQTFVDTDGNLPTLVKIDENGNVHAIDMDNLLSKATNALEVQLAEASSNGTLTEKKYNEIVETVLDSILQNYGMSYDELPSDVKQSISNAGKSLVENGGAGAVNIITNALAQGFNQAEENKQSWMDQIVSAVTGFFDGITEALNEAQEETTKVALSQAVDRQVAEEQTVVSGQSSEQKKNYYATMMTEWRPIELGMSTPKKDEARQKIQEAILSSAIDGDTLSEYSQYLYQGLVASIDDPQQQNALAEIIRRNFGDVIADAFIAYWQIASPSKRMIELASWLSLGASKGIEKTTPEAQAAILALAEKLEKTFDDNFKLDVNASHIDFSAVDSLNLGKTPSGQGTAILSYQSLEQYLADNGINVGDFENFDISNARDMATANIAVGYISDAITHLQQEEKRLIGDLKTLQIEGATREELDIVSEQLAETRGQIVAYQSIYDGLSENINALSDVYDQEINTQLLTIGRDFLNYDYDNATSAQLMSDIFSSLGKSGYDFNTLAAIVGGGANAANLISSYLPGASSEQLSGFMTQGLMYDFDTATNTFTLDENKQGSRMSAQLGAVVGEATGLSGDTLDSVLAQIMTQMLTSSEIMANPEAHIQEIADFMPAGVKNLPEALVQSMIAAQDFSSLDTYNKDVFTANSTEGFLDFFQNQGYRNTRNTAVDSFSTQADSGRSIVEDVSSDQIKNESFNGLLEESVADVFMDAANGSEAFAESLALLSDNSYQAQAALIGIDSAVEDVEHTVKSENIDDMQELLATLGDMSVDEVNLEFGVNVDEDQLDNVKKQIQDEIETQQFSLDIDIGGDMIDTAHSLMESLDDVNNAVSKIDEGFRVSADDIEYLASVFPGITEGAEIAEDGMIQLNQSVAQSALEAAGVSITASTEEQAAKLESYAEYAKAMSENYAQQAAAYATMASGETESTEESQQAITDLKAQATELTNNYQEEQNAGAQTLASNEATYAEGSASAISNTMAEADANVAANLTSMSQNAYMTMSGIAEMARYAALQVSQVGKSEPTLGFVPNLTKSLGGAGAGSVSSYTIAAGDTITIGGKPVTVGDSQANIDAAKEALKTQAISEAYAQGASSAEAAAYALRGKAGGSLSNLGNAGSGKGSSGGGGGGGGGSAYEPKQVELTEKELDRYEKVDTALDAINSELDKLADEQDRLTGDKLIENLEQQVGLLNDQVDIQKEKLAIQKEELAGYDKILADQFGVKFNEYGMVANYKERFDYLLGYLNELERQYNAATTEEAQEAIQEQIDAAKEALDQYEDLIDKRDDLFSNSIKESERLIEEYQNKIEDVMIDTFNKSIDAIDSINQMNELMAEFHQIGKGLKSDNPFRAVLTDLEKINKFMNSGFNKGAIADIINQNNKKIASGNLDPNEIATLKGINSIYTSAANSGATSISDMYAQAVDLLNQQWDQFNATGESAIFGKNSAALIEASESILQAYKEALEQEEQYYEQLEEDIISAYDLQEEAIERQLALYQDIDDELEHRKSLVEMLYGEKSYKELLEINEAEMENSRSRIAFAKEAAAYWKDVYENAEKGSDIANEALEKWRTQAKAAKEEEERALKIAQERLKLQSDEATDKWLNDILGGDLDWMNEQWELINRNSEQYLDNVNAAYETQKLEGKYLELLDKANTLPIQNQITEQMKEQLGYLREKDKLSQYDVAYANAQLDILQKRIALEEAQANKSQMKLRRDSQGNYAYVYTANDDNIRSAQDELLDAQNNAYNLTKDNQIQVQSDMMSVLSDAAQRIKDIWNDTTLSPEKRAERIQLVIDNMMEYITGLNEQLGESEKHIIKDYLDMVSLMSEENAGRIDDVTEQLKNGNEEYLSQIDERFNSSVQNALDNLDNIQDASANLGESVKNTLDEYEINAAKTADAAKESYENLTEGIKDAVDATKELNSQTQTFFNVLKDEAGTLRQAQADLAEYTKKIGDLENKMNEQVARGDRLQAELDKEKLKNADLSNALLVANNNNGRGNGGNSAGGAGGAGGNGSGGNGNGIPELGEYVDFTGQYYHDSAGTAPAGNMHPEGIRIDRIVNAPYGYHIRANGPYDNPEGLGWLKKEQLIGYDTGGYTGTWYDNGGRLAMLHQKEIVLNQMDTVNILAAVDAVRSVATQLKNGAFDAIISNIRDYGKMFDSTSVTDGELEQNVHIDASFPNVYNAEDVRDALLSLNEVASQYASRRV